MLARSSGSEAAQGRLTRAPASHTIAVAVRAPATSGGRKTAAGGRTETAMLIDVLALLVILALALLGWKSGFARQVVHWLALIGAMLLAPPLGLALVPHVSPHLASLPWWVAPTVALLLAWLLLFCLFDLGAVLVHRLVRSAKEDSVIHVADHVAGAVFGGLKGLVIVVFLATGIYLLRTPLGEAYPGLKPPITHSLLIRGVASYNPLVEQIKDWRRKYVGDQQSQAGEQAPPAPESAASAR